MLRYNFGKIFHLRGIQRPYSLLVKHRISPNVAHRIVNSDIKHLSLAHMELLCQLCRCTPNDFIEWTPGNPTEDTPTHPLHALKPDPTMQPVNLRELTLDQLRQLQQMLNGLEPRIGNKE